MPTKPDPGHVKAHLGAHALEEGDVALAVVPEMEVVAHHYCSGVEAADQDLGDEVVCPFGRPLGVEVHHERELSPAILEQREFLVEVRQQQWGRLRAHHAGRVPVEGHDGGQGPDLVCGAADPFDEPAMAEVDAVKGPDRNHRPLRRRRALPRVVRGPHC